MKVNIPTNLNLSDIYHEKPFTIFEFFNFFEYEMYNKLSNEFPPEHYFLNHHNLGNKKYFNNKSNKFDEFINTSKVWRNFYEFSNSEKFIVSIFNICKKNFSFIEERHKIKKINFKKEIRNNFLKKINRKINKIFGHYEVRLGFEFSLMKKGSFIPPHNDTENKLISLMIYFPDKILEEEINLGTNFYKQNGKIIDKWKGDMMNENDSKIFYDNYTVFHHSKFTKNKLVGFIKSKCSWHDVSQIQCDQTHRKSLNINLYKI